MVAALVGYKHPLVRHPSATRRLHRAGAAEMTIAMILVACALGWHWGAGCGRVAS